jgi:hypothetical protein
MLAIWFTFGPDGPCLIESVAAFRQTAGSDALVAVIDDANHPLSTDCLQLVDPDIYRRSTFPRGGNLRGWPCVFGMLEAMASVCAQAEQPGCLKVDSDTLILGLNWLNKDAPLCGFMTGRHAYAMGMCYWLQAKTVAEIRTSFESRWLQRDWQVAEDQTITSEAIWRHGPACLLHTWDRKIAGGWQYGGTDETRFDSCEVVTFGNRRLIKGSGGNDARKHAALIMGQYRERREVDSPPET